MVDALVRAGPELTTLVMDALEHGIRSIEDEGGPLVPFLLSVDAAGQRSLNRFVADPYEDGVAAAQEFAAGLGTEVTLVALAVDGYLRDDADQRVDAILVMGQARGVDETFVFGQAYKSKRFGRGVKADGGWTFVGTGEPLLA